MLNSSLKRIEGLIRPSVQASVQPLTSLSANKLPDVLEKKAKVPPEEIVKLNANENPYGCSPRVNQALADYQNYYLYPDSTQLEERNLLAEYVGTTPDRIVATGGADQLLDLIARLFVDPGDEVIISVPTFEAYRRCTDLCGGAVIEVPRDKDFAIDVNTVKNAVTKKTKLIFLCNPNNPTGTSTPKEDLLEIVKTGVPVVIDEAYYEFTGETMVPFIDQYPNLMIVRVLSKWTGMAGFRIGYGIFTPKIAAYLLAIKPHFNVSVPATIALKESIKDRDYLMGNVKRIIAQRERCFQELKKLSFLKPYPTESNFIFCAVLKGDARKLAQELENRGILIRCFDRSLLIHGIRITIGKQEQNDKVIKALRQISEKLES